MEARANDAAAGAEARHRHETRDAPVRSVVMLGGLFVALVVAGLLVSLWAFGYFTRHQPLGPPASPFENARTLPPAPQLQVTPAADWTNYLKAQMDAVNGYTWVDRKAGIVRIPVDRAMDLIIQRGLPVRGGSGGEGQAVAPKAKSAGAAGKP